MHLRFGFLGETGTRIMGEIGTRIMGERGMRPQSRYVFDHKSSPQFTVRSFDFYCERSQCGPQH